MSNVADLARDINPEVLRVLTLEARSRLFIRTYNPYTDEIEPLYKFRILENGSPIVEVQQEKYFPVPTRMEYGISQRFESQALVGRVIAPMCSMTLCYPGTDEGIITSPVKSVFVMRPGTNLIGFRNWDMKVR